MHGSLYRKWCLLSSHLRKRVWCLLVYGRRGALLRGLAPNLNRYVVHRQRDRRLGLGGLDPDPFQVEVAEQAVGDRRAQPLQGLVGALLSHQRHELADLGIVDRVLHAIGDGGVGFADVQTQVDQQALADLALGLGYAVVRVEREAADLDRDGLKALVILVVLILFYVLGLVVVLVFVVALVAVARLNIVGKLTLASGTIILARLLALLAAHMPPNVAAATARWWVWVMPVLCLRLGDWGRPGMGQLLYTRSDASSSSMPMTRATRSMSASWASNVAARRHATVAIRQSSIPRGVMPAPRQRR